MKEVKNISDKFIWGTTEGRERQKEYVRDMFRKDSTVSKSGIRRNAINVNVQEKTTDEKKIINAMTLLINGIEESVEGITREKLKCECALLI